MKLSIVVIFHNMQREAARTLYSLGSAYQTGLSGVPYEVIAIDNGSAAPLDGDTVRAMGPEFRYRYFDTASVSPVAAVNAGVEMARGELIAVIVDGARLASPGLVGMSVRAARAFDAAFICALAWHLGPDDQGRSMLEGYDQTVEDRLLDGIGWPANGYDLFSVSAIASSSRDGILAGVPPECSWFCVDRRTFLDLGGFDPRFRTPGGGLVNHDFRERALARPGLTPVVLLGEGVFHQFHGGVASNVPPEQHPMARFQEEYTAIHGRPYLATPSPPAMFFGALPDQARRFLGPRDDRASIAPQPAESAAKGLFPGAR